MGGYWVLGRSGGSSDPQDSFQPVFRVGLGSFGFARTIRDFEVFAKIGPILGHHRFGAPFAALMRRSQVVEFAVEANPQIRPATRAGLAASGLSAKRPDPTAILTAALVFGLRLGVFERHTGELLYQDF